MKLHIDTSKYPGDVEKRLKYISHSGPEGLLTEDFFKSHTNFQNFLELLTSINCNLDAETLFDDLEDGKYDDAIQQQTKFCSWKALCEQAAQELLHKR